MANYFIICEPTLLFVASHQRLKLGAIMFKNLLIILLITATTPAIAWLCPNNFNTINPGDTLDQVKTQCGPPIAEAQSMEEPNVPQEWGYYVRVAPPNPATIRVSVVIV